jgi:hypothetical protein
MAYMQMFVGKILCHQSLCHSITTHSDERKNRKKGKSLFVRR